MLELAEFVVIVLFNAIGNALLKVGINSLSNASLSTFFTKDFYVTVFTSKSAIIFIAALAFNFVAKLFVLSPLSRHQFGITLNILAPLATILIIIMGYVVFKETYSARELTGVALASLSIWLMSG